MSLSFNRPILVTGANGLLGSAVVEELRHRNLPVVGWNRQAADLSRPDHLDPAFAAAAPGAVIHCAGWTNVDLAEDQPEACRTVNVTSAARLAALTAAGGAAFVHISSGGIFDGTKPAPYDESDRPAPLNVYHRSKHDSERAVIAAHPQALVARVGWLYGGDASQPRNFVAARLREARGRHVLAASREQRGSPTWTRDAAACLVDLLLAGRRGLCHVANAGDVTRCDYVAAILRLAGSPVRVEPAAPGAFIRKARVPANEAIVSRQLPVWDYPPLRPWLDALAVYLSQQPLPV